MRPTELAANFAGLARGELGPFQDTAMALMALLESGDHKSLIELSLALSGADTDAAREAFDRLMDTFCIEPVHIRGVPLQGWRAYAGLVVHVQPAGTVVSRFENPEKVAHAIAKHVGLRERDVRVLPFLLPTNVLFHQSPVDIFNFCRRVKGDAEIATSPAERRPELDRLLSVDTDKRLINGWASQDDRPTFMESVVIVLVRGGERQSTRQFELLQELDEGNFTFEAQYDMQEENVEPLLLTHQMVGFGGAWRIFRNALHMAEAFGLGSLMKHVAGEHGLELAQLAVTFAQVEEADGSTTMRVAVHRDKSALLAGVVQKDLAEPEQFIAAARKLLASLRVTRVFVSPDLVSASQVDRNGTLHVLVQGIGWYCAPETYMNFD